MIDLDLTSYDYVISALSGGKDSIAATLSIQEQMQAQGSKAELICWHHSIDGAPHGPDGKGLYGIPPDEPLMDWPITEDYCRRFCQHIGVPLELSFLSGGFKREMLRENQRKAPTFFEVPGEGFRSAGGVKGKLTTRRKYPQLSNDLQVRWCSGSLKIDVADIALANQPERFNNRRILFITGERREESPGRAKYAEFGPHRKHSPTKGRHIDHYRHVIDWTERDIWDIFERRGIVPHPCYRIGFSRCSCAVCIFASDDQMATLFAIAQEYVQKQAKHETMFGTTVHRTKSVMQRVFRGTPYEAIKATELVELAMSRFYKGEIWVPPHRWELPAGAYGEDKAGPT